MQIVLEVWHLQPTSREREALSFPRAIGEIEINDVLVGNACAHRLCFEIINDVHVQLNGYLLARSACCQKVLHFGQIDDKWWSEN